MGGIEPEYAIGPEGEDWRVPVSELQARLRKFSEIIANQGLNYALIQTPVDLYYYTGSRQNGTLVIFSDSEKAPIYFVRRSLNRALWECGGTDCPIEIKQFPRMKDFPDVLTTLGCSQGPGMQLGELPHSFADFFIKNLSQLGPPVDITNLVHGQREVKSAWELEMMKEAAKVQYRMFEAINEIGAEGLTELDLVAQSDKISRESGFGGIVQMRRYPMMCNRGVVLAGRSGGVTSFFDSAVGGAGPHPLAGFGAGFGKVKPNEPVLVDLVHVHRGYVVDATRMFSKGKLENHWVEKLDDMIEIRDTVLSGLGRGDDCSKVWEDGFSLTVEMGHENNLMGLPPDQSKFLGHSVGLQLDESPVVAKGFDRPLPVGGVMAIEPKVVYSEGSIGTEDTWLRTDDGMINISMGDSWPHIMEW